MKMIKCDRCGTIFEDRATYAEIAVYIQHIPGGTKQSIFGPMEVKEHDRFIYKQLCEGCTNDLMDFFSVEDGE